jgi:hypothetical protein
MRFEANQIKSSHKARFFRKLELCLDIRTMAKIMLLRWVAGCCNKPDKDPDSDTKCSSFTLQAYRLNRPSGEKKVDFISEKYTYIYIGIHLPPGYPK